MASDDNRLKVIAAGGIATVLLAAAVYGLVRHVPFLNRPVPQPRLTGGTGGVAETGRATIVGVITGPDGAPEAARVTLVRTADGPRLPAPQGRGRFGGFGRGQGPLSATTGADGRFALNNVPAGAFWIVAHAEVVGAAPALPTHFWAISDVSSNGRSTVEMTLALAPGGTITGRMEFNALAGAAQPDAGGVTMSLTPADAKTQALLTIGAPRARPDDSGAFVIPAVAPGRYTLDVSPVPDWSLDSAVIDGQDRIDRPFEVPSGWGTRRATLVFSDRPNAVTGLVRHATGQPASFMLVMVFSAEPSLRRAPRRVQAVRADSAGRFTLSGLPTGDYLVAPAGDVPPQRWYTPESFSEMAPHAVPVAFSHGETKTVALQVR
jgi:hypothetical protein